MEHLSNNHEDHPNQHENSHKLCDEMGHLVETERRTWSEFLNKGIAIVEQILVSRNKQIQKSRTMKMTVWDPSRKDNDLSKVIWDKKVMTEFTRLISSTRIGMPVLMMDVKVSKNKNISRWVDRENLIYVRWNRIKNCAQWWGRWPKEEKEERH